MSKFCFIYGRANLSGTTITPPDDTSLAVAVIEESRRIPGLWRCGERRLAGAMIVIYARRDEVCVWRIETADYGRV